MQKVERGRPQSARRERHAARKTLSFIHKFIAFYFLPFAFCLLPSVPAQQRTAIVDRWVATVGGTELITYSDLIWQLSLEPATPIDSPRPDDLNRVLELVIRQRLIVQEAESLPTIAPTPEEIDAEINRIINRFPSREEFYRRLERVGLTETVNGVTSVSDQLREIARERAVIEKFVDFRFRSFTIVTPEEVAAYYRDVYVPRFRRRTPGVIVPTLEQAGAEIERELRESKIASDIDTFLEDARTRADVVILSGV